MGTARQSAGAMPVAGIVVSVALGVDEIVGAATGADSLESIAAGLGPASVAGSVALAGATVAAGVSVIAGPHADRKNIPSRKILKLTFKWCDRMDE
jgi:hypothetical protein